MKRSLNLKADDSATAIRRSKSEHQHAKQRLTVRDHREEVNVPEASRVEMIASSSGLSSSRFSSLARMGLASSVRPTLISQRGDSGCFVTIREDRSA